MSKKNYKYVYGPVSSWRLVSLRPCKAKPLLKEELDRVKSYFDGLNAIYVYNASKKEVKPISDEKTLLRRGKID